MGNVAATVTGITGIVAGVVIGYALWGHTVVDQAATLRQVTRELAVTKTWLWDEIRTSDERYERLASRLAKALAELRTARTELARTRAAVSTAPAASPPSIPPPAGRSPTADAPAHSAH